MECESCFIQEDDCVVLFCKNSKQLDTGDPHVVLCVSDWSKGFTIRSDHRGVRGPQGNVGLRVSVRLSTYGGRTHRPIRVYRK